MLCVFAGQVEDEYVGLAKSLMEKAEAKGVTFLLPEDVVVADKVNRPTQAFQTASALSVCLLGVTWL